MADIKIDTNSDMLIEGGDIVIVRDQEAIAQHIQMRLATWLNESVYDPNAGTPFIEVIFQPNTSPNAIRLVLEQRVLTTPGVTGVVIDLEIDTEARTATATGNATSIRGDINFSISLSSDSNSVSVTTL